MLGSGGRFGLRHAALCGLALTLMQCGGATPPDGSVGASSRTKGKLSAILTPRGAAKGISLRAARARLRFEASDTIKHDVFAAILDAGVVNGYKKESLACTIGPIVGATNVNFDRRHRLWVVNQQPAIVPFENHCGNPIVRDIAYDYNGSPADLAFASDGTKYVLDIWKGTGGDIAIIPPGSRTVSSYLTDSSVNDLCIGDAVDSHGNAYMSCVHDGPGGDSGEVVEFAGGTMPGTVLSAVTLGLPGGIRFDRSDNMIVEDQVQFTAKLFAPPYQQAPYKVVQLMGHPIGCALSSEEKWIACSNVDAYTIDFYTYPAFEYRYSVSVPDAQGGLATAIHP